MNNENVFKPTSDITDISTFKITDIPSNQLAKTNDNVIDEIESITTELESDFQAARQNISDIVEKGNDLLDKMIDLAKGSDSPRAFEVAGLLAKSLIEANKDLIDLHEKKAKIQSKTPDQSGGTTNIQNNNMIVASPAEIIKMLRQNKQ